MTWRKCEKYASIPCTLPVLKKLVMVLGISTYAGVWRAGMSYLRVSFHQSFIACQSGVSVFLP